MLAGRPKREEMPIVAAVTDSTLQVMVEEPDPYGETWMQMGLPNSTTSYHLPNDLEKEIKELKLNGMGKIDETRWSKFAWLKDPDGNSLCLHRK